MSTRPTTARLLDAEPFRWFLCANGLWIAALSLQGFLTTWLLVGELQLPAEVTGRIHTGIVALPILATLVGAVHGDRSDPRRLLVTLQLLATIPVLSIAILVALQGLSLAAVLALAASMAILQAYTDPVRATLLNHAAPGALRPGVSLTMASGAAAGIAAYSIGAQLEAISLPVVIGVQAILLGAAAACTAALPRPHRAPAAPSASWLRDLRGGVRIALRVPLIRNVLTIGLLANLFDAGGFILLHAYLVRDVYAGGPALLALTGAAFTAGSVVATLGLAWVPGQVPLGQLYIGVQLLRALTLAAIWLSPTIAGYSLCVFCWGATMGAASTCGRTLLQESTPDRYRSRVLGLSTTLFLVAALVSPLLLGELIALSDAPTALLPGIVLSLGLFAAALRMPALRKAAPAHNADEISPGIR